MDKNMIEKATDILKGRLAMARSVVQEDFKGTKPYRKEPMSNRELIYNYETQGYEQFSQIAEAQGIEAAILWQKNMELEKAKFQRRTKNA